MTFNSVDGKHALSEISIFFLSSICESKMAGPYYATIKENWETESMFAPFQRKAASSST